MQVLVQNRVLHSVWCRKLVQANTCTKCRSYEPFLVCNSIYAIARYAIARPSVCPSVTRVDQSKNR